MEDKLLIFLKGILMGICDLIPGISGGTIAFITGIYERLINSIRNISGLKFKKQEIIFLLILLLGISSSLLIGSRIIKSLLDNYFVYTMSFFIGLILASSKIIFNNIQNHKIKNRFFGVAGFIFGILLVFIIPVNITSGFSYVFLGGFVAINALLLPGISGAFILLIMGLYEIMLETLKNIPEHLNYLIAFVLGAVLGAFTISRIVSFLFKKYKCKTLYFLLGLVIGALSIPIKRIFLIDLGIRDFFGIIVFLSLGILIVFIIGNLNKK